MATQRRSVQQLTIQARRSLHPTILFDPNRKREHLPPIAQQSPSDKEFAPIEFGDRTLVIGGAKKVAPLIDTWATAAISLVSPKVPDCKIPVPSTSCPHLILRCRDTTDHSDPESAKESHTRRLLEFEPLRQPRLVVHCAAGISRSTAAALGILVHHGVEPDEALDLISTARPGARPNALIVALLDPALPGLFAAFDAWARGRSWWPFTETDELAGLPNNELVRIVGVVLGKPHRTVRDLRP